MTKTRLNQHHRQLLRDFATKGIECPKEQKANDKAYAKAARLVSELVAKKFPAADMAVLAKYNASEADACLHGGAPDGRHVGFQFVDSDPLIPVLPNAYCSSRSFAWGAPITEAIEAFDKASEALKRARADKLEKYRALILTARTFDEVLEVWPAVEALRQQITRQTALVALSDDVARFIREDNAGAAAQQAA